MDNGNVKVVSPIDGTPAAKAGLLTNDLITHLDGMQIVGLTLEQAVEKMRGPAGTSITLTISRNGRDYPFDVKVMREVIRITAVKTRLEGDGEVGYIKISAFNEQTHANLVRQVEALMKAGKRLKGFIVDLRNNPGGLLDQAIAVSDDFLNNGTIVTTKDRLQETRRANARAGDITNGKKIIVLINGGTASAAEIVTGALQDQKRATIIGTRSFGKGSVQTIIPLGADNGALRLTTALYYTPSGRSIQASGIVPDLVVEQEMPADSKGNAPTVKSEASLPNHLGPARNTREQEGSSAYVPTDPARDTQLQVALRMIRG
jgi:carboxyl-terminal processing protease